MAKSITTTQAELDSHKAECKVINDGFRMRLGRIEKALWVIAMLIIADSGFFQKLIGQ